MWLKTLLERKLIVGFLLCLILVTGVYSLTKLKVELIPSVDFDSATIIATTDPSMTSLEVEKNITNRIENQLESIQGVESYTSKSLFGLSSISVKFNRGNESSPFSDIQTAMNQLMSELHSTKIQVIRDNTIDGAEMYVDIYGGHIHEMSKFATDVVKRKLESLPEVSQVEIDGLKEKEIIIRLDLEKLHEYGLHPENVISTLAEENQNIKYTNGESGAKQYSVKWDTSFNHLTDIENFLIQTANGTVELKKLAEITLEETYGNTKVWKGGDPNYLLIKVFRSSQVSEVELTEAVREEIKNIKSEGLVGDFQFEELISKGDFIKESINNITSNLLVGGLLAIITVLIFLKSMRPTLIISISIPLSILLTFSFMWLLDYSFNMISLISLGLGIGLIIDTSIVILESIYSKKSQGLTTYDSVLKGTKEVRGALIASILTTLVVFLPIGLIGGAEGELVRNLSLVIVFSLVSSFVVSFTIIPVLFSKFIKNKEKKESKESYFLKKYGLILNWLISKRRRQWSLIAVFVIAFCVLMPFVSKVPISIMPDIYDRQAQVLFMLEEELTTAEKEKLVDDIGSRVRLVPDLRDYSILELDSTLIYAFVNFTKDEEATLPQKELSSKLISSLTDLLDLYPISAISNGLDSESSGEQAKVIISGDDLDELKNIANDLKEDLLEINGVQNVSLNMNTMLSEDFIEINEDEVKKAGMLPHYIRKQIEGVFFNLIIGQMTLDDSTTPIKVSTAKKIANKTDFEKYEVTLPNGEQKPLNNFVTIKQDEIPIVIEKINGSRGLAVNIGFDSTSIDLGTLNQSVQDIIESYSPPSGYSLAISGDLEKQQELMETILLILLISIILVYGVMAIQFNKLLQPLIVMFIIPLTFIGIILGLLLTKKELNILSGIGIVMLIGIVVNNGILILDRINQLRKQDKNLFYSVIEASKNRVRPILMTSFSTVFAMLPFAFATGSGGDFQSPLAVVVISGLLFSTLITLVIIPVTYCIFEDFARITKFKKRKISKDKIESM